MARTVSAVAALLLVLAIAGGPVVAATPSPSASPVVSGVPGSSAVPGSSVVPSPSPTPRPRPGPTLPPLDPLPRLDPATSRPALFREVVAYLPYWMVTSGFQGAPAFDPATDPWIRDGRLTDLVLFSVGIRRDGALQLNEANARFVLSPAATRIIKAAHAKGIRVLVSFVSGGYTNNDVLFKDPAAAERFAREAAALVKLRGLDGADLDVELIKKPRFKGYAAMVAALKAALVADNPDARVTVATNGNRSGATMASMALEAGADRAFLMGYAYRSGGSSPVGSISPLDHPGDLDLVESLQLYRDKGIDLGQVILGLPTYGMTWPTDGPSANAPRATGDGLGGGAVTGFYRALVGPQPFGAVWDEVTTDPSARRRWFDPVAGTWWQTYVDTPATWRPKLLLVLREELAGVGIWALGYEGGLEGYPAMIDEVFGRPVVATAAVTPAVGTALDVAVSVETLDVIAPTDWVQLSNDGETWSAPIAAEAAVDVPWRLADGTDGVREVLVRSMDAEGNLSAPFAARTVIDRTGPLVTGPSLRRVDGGWRISFSQSDLTGFAPVRLRTQVSDGAWSAWHPLRTPADAFVAAPEGVPVTVQLVAGDPLGNTTLAIASAP